MAIAYGTSSSNNSTVGGESATAPRTTTPASTAAGDYLAWGVMTDSGGGAITPPSGFTALPSGTALSVSLGNGLMSLYAKTADGGEGANLTGACSSAAWVCFAVRITGTLVGRDTSAGAANGTGATSNAVIPAITTNYANELILLIQAAAPGVGGSFTPDAAATEATDVSDGARYFETSYQTTTTATSYGSWTAVDTNIYPFDGYARYYALVVGENLAPTGAVFPRRPNVAVQRAAYW